jgi:hypothetical protein
MTLKILALGIGALALGCTGYLDSGAPGAGSPGLPGAVGASGSGPNPDPTTSDCTAAQQPSVPEVRLRRLSRQQYDHTLRDLGLLGEGASIAVAGFTGDSTVGGRRHGFSIGGGVDPVLARDLLDAALSVAASPQAAALVGCQPTSALEEETCVRSFIASLGRRAFRRALSQADQDQLFSVFSGVRGQADFQAGVQAVTAAILSAPEFLYLLEDSEGTAGQIVPLGGFALASRLSYFLWDSLPDDALLGAAETGQLGTPEGLRSAAERLLGDERARRGVRRFLNEWTGIDHLPEAPKQGVDWYTPELVADLQASFMGGLENAFFGPEPTFRELMGSSKLWVNDRIALAYGLPAAGSALAATSAPSERVGFLTHPGFMALMAKPTRGDPIHRGLFVREQLLCDELPDPPVTDQNGNPIVFNVGASGPGVTNRQRFAEHTAAAECAGCHQLIDPLGFGLESYDAVGRFRSSDENGNAIDASGAVQGGGDAAGPFQGGSELVARLAQSQTVADCLALQWFRYALAREEADEDACALQSVEQKFQQASGNLKELLIALTTSDAFRYRKVGVK